jgi:membrane carboxypeptidase/penicillin-binding protein
VVWIGYDKPSSLGSAATGGGFAAPVWGRIMRQVYSDQSESEGWAPPAGLVRARVDTNTGYVIQDGCYMRGFGEGSEIFLEESLPPAVCPQRDFWTNLWRRITGDEMRSQIPRPNARPIRPFRRGGTGVPGEPD